MNETNITGAHAAATRTGAVFGVVFDVVFGVVFGVVLDVVFGVVFGVVLDVVFGVVVRFQILNLISEDTGTGQ